MNSLNGLWLCALVLVSATSSCAATQLSSSAILFYGAELATKQFGMPQSYCSLLLQRAKAQGSDSVNIVMTHYWLDEGFLDLGLKPDVCAPDAWRYSSKVDTFCHKQRYDSTCQPFDAAAIKQFQADFTVCLDEAFRLFKSVLISPHLDQGLRLNAWRNMLIFDPLAKDAKGYSYWDTMLGPMTAAAKAVLPRYKGKTLWFGMQGEMGATIFNYPASYTTISKRIHAELKGTGAAIKVGVELNPKFVAGVVNHGNGTVAQLPPSPLRYLGTADAVLPFKQWPRHAALAAALPATKALFQALDFIGVSMYSKAPVDVQPSDFEDYALRMLELELAQMGINLQALLQSGKALLWAEYGLGGGLSRCGDVPAVTPKDIGTFPSSGIQGSYRAATDPWRNPGARAYSKKYHQAALALLAAGGQRFRVDGAYIWSLVSWDVEGIHPASSSSEGSYAQPEVAALIRAHNAKNRG